MAVPTTRAEFKEYCLRRLGKPVIDINVSDEQIDDRIDDALRYYWDYHFDGVDMEYYKVQVDDTIRTNGYITMPENIIGVVELFSIGDALNTSNLFSIRYQIALNDLYNLTNVSLVPYYMTMQHLRVIEEILVGKPLIRYNRHKNYLHIDIDWNKITNGQYIIVKAYKIVDPDTFVDVWKDRWLLEYATNLIKRQWGNNLTKFIGQVMPGGVQFNGQKILDDAEQKIAQLESEMINSYSLPIMDFIG